MDQGSVDGQWHVLVEMDSKGCSAARQKKEFPPTEWCIFWHRIRIYKRFGAGVGVGGLLFFFPLFYEKVLKICMADWQKNLADFTRGPDYTLGE